MNEELQTAVSSLINKALDGVDATTGFLQAEIPEYLYQLLLWYGVKSFIYFLLAVSIIPVVVFVYRKANEEKDRAIEAKLNGERWTYWSTVGGVSSSSYDFKVNMALFWAFLVIASIVAFFLANLEWLQIWIAPKVWLFEYASSLIK